MLTRKSFLIPLMALASLGIHAGEVKFKMGPKATYFNYREPGHMKDTGFLYGVSSELDTTFVESQFRFFPSLDVSIGKTTYDGRLTDGTPWKTRSRNTIMEIRLPVGYNFVQTPENTLTGFLGLGYSQLHNKDVGPYSYHRIVQRAYAPVGLAYRTAIGEKTAFELRGEYDYFIRGKVRSKLSDLNPNRPTEINTQRKGGGARFQATVERELSNTTLFASATYQLWKIKDSDIKSRSYKGFLLSEFREPKNTTHMLGLTVGATF